MNKKTNTLLFILAGTLFNILVTILSFLIILFIYARVLHPVLPENSIAWILPLGFVAAIVVSFVVYRLVIKTIVKKVDMDKYFSPIFGAKRPPPKS